MSGTTLCPYCDTRFKISDAQLEGPSVMVRCGNCLRVFNARANFVSDQPDRQLKLPILDEPAELLSSEIIVLQPMTLAEQVAIVKDEDEGEFLPKRHIASWGVTSLLLFLMLFAQTAYFFRVDLAAHFPGLKPALEGYCRLLNCSVPLPQKADLMSIESSSLDADPAYQEQITLSALLRNRASYAQDFPSLELTLNDTQDEPVARRIFRPSDYLPPSEDRTAGLQPNHEIGIKLRLGTKDIKPMGYRLVLLYSGS